MPEQTLTDRLFDDADKGAIDPFALFEEWLAEAVATEPNDPNAMALATVDEAGLPDLRMVLLNARDARGFVFFSHLDSVKGVELAANPRAALLFHWKSLRRQVRIRGPVEIVAASEADAYFARRPRQSQIGTHASRQSRPLESRAALLETVSNLETAFGDRPVPRPARWTGVRVQPREMEFWKDGAFRLHDRVRFSRSGLADTWTRQRLYP